MIVLNKIYQGNSIHILRTFPDNFIDCCVTSPPYWGLRDYGTGKWEGGNKHCNHRRDNKNANPDWAIQTRGKVANGVGDEIYKEICAKCGAIRIDEQIGLERTPEEFIHKLVLVFREVKRVMKPTGTLWVNIGDSYCGGKGMSGSRDAEYQEQRNLSGESMNKSHQQMGGRDKMRPQDGKHDVIKPKDLVGIPWMLAFALRADGWWLRSDIIWSKPNPMPESVTDRPTKSHEYIFLLAKSQHYYYDAEAIKEIANYDGRKDTVMKGSEKYQNGYAPTTTATQSIALKGHERWKLNDKGERVRNKRSVWVVSPKPLAEAHFATFPEDLIEPCIKAGSSEYGCCETCGAPYERVVEKEGALPGRDRNHGGRTDGMSRPAQWKNGENPTTTKTTGWAPSCDCLGGGVIPSTILDVFNGAGTTSVVAKKLNRNYIGTELNQEYISIAERRMQAEFGLFNIIT